MSGGSGSAGSGTPASGERPGLKREIGLWQGTALNVIDMVGVGPFVTLPLILAAMGGQRALGAWLLGALLAICDGLVTAELSASLPEAGGSYAFLREAYGRDRWGRLVSFLFLFQIVFSAPLSIASGALGFARYAGVPAKGESFVAALFCLVVVGLLFRRIGTIGRFSIVLWAGVLATMALVIGVGLPHVSLSAFRFWDAPLHPSPEGLGGGLGVALAFAVYDYLGYYNICYVAEEVIEPTKTIPRVIVVSIVLVAVLYVLMNVSVVSILPMEKAMTSRSAVADAVEAVAGVGVARVATGLILLTAFGSVFSLTLGYSRVLYAAGRDGNFFRVFARLHPAGGYPTVALSALGGVAALFCFLPLGVVLKAIVSIRALVPFVAQIAGALVLRRRFPHAARPFRMWLYPLPALVALGLWLFILFSPGKGFQAMGLAVLAAGAIAFVLRSRLRGEWPFGPRAAS